MKRIVFISGLGANELAFSRIGDLGLEKVFVKWLVNNPDESFEEYTLRIIEKYHIESGDVLVGLSFGGLVAQEIAKILNSNIVILISSFRDVNDLKSIFRMPLQSGIYRLMPTFKVPILDEMIANFLNSGSKESIPILKNMIESTDFKLMKWSLKMIAESNGLSNRNLQAYNIIGDQDKILKLWKNSTTTIIKNGSHFMVFDKSREVTKIILDILKSQNYQL